jgi:hypothetical protein
VIAELVNGLCARLSLPAPAPDNLGGWRLAFPDGYAVHIQGARDHLALSGEVCALPEDAQARDALCRELLALSLGRASRECKTSLPRLTIEGGAISLRQICPAPGSPDDLEAAVEHFLNLLEKWSALAHKEERQRMVRSGGAAMGVIIP